MTTRFAKTAIVTASTMAIIAILLVYPALSSAYAQTATPSSTSSSTATSSSTGTASTSSNTTLVGPWGPGGQGFGIPPNGGGGWGPGGQGDHGFGQGFGRAQSRADVAVGQSITFTSTSGQYGALGSTTNNGTASGSIVFTVSGNLTEGYTLSIGGSVVIGSTTYTISSGSAQMSPSASTISGQGATSPTGAFILQGTARGSFVGSTATISLDLKSGTTEYVVYLNGTV
ncbi:MAG: hypothetical protein ABSF83_12920 [Nitrososphaerales archaeon]|jgi:hypothetical protein